MKLNPTYETHLTDATIEKKQFLYLVPEKLIESFVSIPANIPESFTQFLVGDQKEKIDTLKKLGPNVKLRGLSDIPLQIFISMPKKGEKEQKGDRMCLFMFVNQKTIGKIDNVTAFISKEKFIVDTFYQIFTSYWGNANTI